MASRRRALLIGTAIAATAALATACGSAGSDAAVTVTKHVTVPATGQQSAPGTASGPAATGPTPASQGPNTGAPASGAPDTGNALLPPGALPDGFVPTKLKPGEKPPQFVVISFDGSGWHEKWQYWFGIEDQVPMHFTANLTGLYLLDEAHKDAYQGPGHAPGKTSLGSWNTPDEVKQEILDLNEAYHRGDEIGSHFNGHFCDDNQPGANHWSTADWNNELDQFYKFIDHYQQIDRIPGLPKLDFTSKEVIGERTPCLEGHPADLYPALAAHHIVYDESFTRHGIAWPVQSTKYTPGHPIWELGMAGFPMHGITAGHGADHFQITMDYNFWYSQEKASNNVSPAQSQRDMLQVQATYQDMFDATYAGNRAPILLGNHFEAWNNNAYTEALGNFVLANCGKPDVKCVPFRDVVAWLDMQDPSVLARLQALPPEVGPPTD